MPRFFAQVADSDVGWHLAIGRSILTTAIPFENQLSWTSPHYPFYATSWLYDLLVWLTLDHLGCLAYQGVHFAAFGLVLLLLGLTAWRAGGRWALAALPLVAAQLQAVAAFRPELVTWVGIAAVLALGSWGRTAGIRTRWLAVAVVALAGNLHSGAIYSAGFLVCFAGEAFWRSRRPAELAVAILGVLALTANPGGIFNLVYLAKCLLVPPPVPLAEMMSAWQVPAVLRFNLPVVLIGVALAIRYRRAEPTAALMSVTFAVLAMRTIRLSPELYLSMVPLVARALSDAAWSAGSCVRVVAIAVAQVLIALATGYPDQVRNSAYGPRFDAVQLPVRAAGFLTEARLTTNGFNNLEDGGYLELAVPSFRAFLDGRILAFPPQVFSDTAAALRHPSSFPGYLDRHGAKWALLNRDHYGEVVAALKSSAEWVTEYQDDDYVVLLRRAPAAR